MPHEPYVYVSHIKSLSKLLQKRFALKLSAAQIVVCQASGYSGFHRLYRRIESDVVPERCTMADCEVWHRRLGFALGSDLEVLFKQDELDSWFRRIHGIHSPDVEASTVGVG